MCRAPSVFDGIFAAAFPHANISARRLPILSIKTGCGQTGRPASEVL
ncbi:hypothetical protein ANACOL_00588 [Anaerotruncus colihominis DSM 17241]|uniref:Uncharacterized protein n=1 Tax=Anaerotruncus colihominis DSM 17241 TaxID=445972 RepID=B0P760_9FIRM|nr:hypothetical protein ANACOL_00588 [Anaerotruncus colihominis DSM 17241]